MKNTHKLVTLSLFTVIALTIFIVESAIVLPISIPGVKLGLANIITLLVLCNYKPFDAFLVLFVRILLSALFSGQMLMLFYSCMGGLFCFVIMSLLNRFLSGHFLVLTSIFGALAHNAGQLLAAYLVMRSVSVLTYLPFLTLSGIITGLFTGLCAHFAQKKLLPAITAEKHLPQ